MIRERRINIKMQNFENYKEKVKGFLINKENILECLFAIIIAGMAAYRLGEMTMPTILNDEFGYWSNSMMLTGQDWSSVTAWISYYSYGYSLILCVVRAVADILGYGWDDLYKVAIVFNIIFVVIGYFLSVKIAKRFMKHMNWIMILSVCFVAAVYPSGMIYTHYTLTECTLTFVFWLLAYTMMRAVDKPNIANHIGMAFLAIYLYTVHQRALGIILAVLIMVFLFRLLKINTLRQTISFLGSLYVFFVIHSFIKLHIRNINYLGNPPESIYEMIPDVFTKSTLLFLALIIAAVIWLFLIEKGKVKLSFILAVIAIFFAGSIGLNGLGLAASGDAEFRMQVNDLAGQIGILKNLFTKNGLIRLGTSMLGKWYYLTAASGLVICWGLKDMIQNAVYVIADSCKRLWAALWGKEYIVSAELSEDFRGNIFLFGMFLSFAGAFMVSALYKEGLYSADDLFNGRYVEYLIGFLLIYSVDRILADRHWLGSLFLFVCIFIAASILCQRVLDLLGRTRFQKVHAFVFGMFLQDGDMTGSQIKEIVKYVLPLAVSFIMIFKAGALRLTDNYLTAIRLGVALLIPITVWCQIYTGVIDDTAIPLQQNPGVNAAPRIASWIDRLSEGEPIYFDPIRLYYRKAAYLQYMCGEKSITLTNLGKMDFEEDALFVLHIDSLDDERVKENCEIVAEEWIYVLAINKNQHIKDRWEFYRDALKPQSLELIEEE